MARKVFFSFHYERDIWRASQVRNCWLTMPDRDTAGFWDKASWEEVKKKGDDATKAWIDKQLDGTSVTAVLIGYETASRYYVQYEIEQSYKRGNGLLGIYIHNLRDAGQHTDFKGKNPFENIQVPDGWYTTSLALKVATYDWVYDRGYDNIATWIENAAKVAGR